MWHLRRVIFLKTQSKASIAIFLWLAEKMPKIPNTIRARKQIMTLKNWFWFIKLIGSLAGGVLKQLLLLGNIFNTCINFNNQSHSGILMSPKKVQYDYICYLKYTKTFPFVGVIPVNAVMDEPIAKELVCQRTSQGLALLIKQDYAFQALPDTGLNQPLLPNPLDQESVYNFTRIISNDHCLEKGFYYGLQSLARKYGQRVLDGLEFYALDKQNSGAFAPLDWQQISFRKSLDKIVREISTELKTASSPS